MFYDFVHQCVNCFNYFAKETAAGLNYFIPLCLGALCALLCALYFVMMGISFKTDTYDFRKFRCFIWLTLLFACCAEDSSTHFCSRYNQC